MNKILAFVSITFCYFLNSCTKNKVYKEYTIKDLDKAFDDTLKSNNVGRIIGIEILIDGEINGEAILEFENGAGRFSTINLKGKINQTYETEWYDSKMFFKYTPISSMWSHEIR